MNIQKIMISLAILSVLGATSGCALFEPETIVDPVTGAVVVVPAAPPRSSEPRGGGGGGGWNP